LFLKSRGSAEKWNIIFIPPFGPAKNMTSQSAVSQTGSDGREREREREKNVKLRKQILSGQREREKAAE
jgi:hypothetical protein